MLLSSLNTSQRKAVLAEDKRLLVLAGAGSGKTKTLIQKVLYLISEKNVKPANILAITFTKNAINEMIDRLIIAGRRVWSLTAKERGALRFAKKCFKDLPLRRGDQRLSASLRLAAMAVNIPVKLRLSFQPYYYGKYLPLLGKFNKFIILPLLYL